MRVKKGVALKGLRPEMRPVLMVADDIWRFHGHGLVVTSTTDGVHSPRSLHPYGWAVDFRTRDFNGSRERQTVFEELQKKLKSITPLYGVYLEKTHMHTQYKPRTWMMKNYVWQKI